MERRSMKMLFIHCDHFSYLTTQRTKMAEEIPNGCKSCAFKDALVVFTAAEKVDEKDPCKVVDKGVKEIIDVAGKLGVRNIVLFPFVHLSDNISDAGTALKILGTLYERLKNFDYVVDKAPFGWEKVFSLTSKGHPLAELSRTVRP
jgi:threonyl-tRNA synthetase